MKTRLKALLQRSFGFHHYLVVHSVIVALTLRFRRNEGSVLAFISRLAVDSNVLDVGANVGTMTLLFARRCRLGKVLAFEPIPESYRAAATVLWLFRVTNASLYQYGVGEREESVTMVMPTIGANVRLEGLSHVVDPDNGRSENGTLYKVPFVSLDNFADLRNLRIDAIKIDVEDHERFVLRGGLKIIARDRPLLYCEMWSDQNKKECTAMLNALDYGLYVAAGDQLVAFDPVVHTQMNFFFVPRERVAEFVRI